MIAYVGREREGRLPWGESSVAVFSVDQAYRIKGNRSHLTQPVVALAGSSPLSGNDDAESIELLCECSAPHCTATVVVLRSDYERLGPERRQLVVSVGHELDFAPVRVTQHTETYELVEPWRR